MCNYDIVTDKRPLRNHLNIILSVVKIWQKGREYDLLYPVYDMFTVMIELFDSKSNCIE